MKLIVSKIIIYLRSLYFYIHREYISNIPSHYIRFQFAKLMLNKIGDNSTLLLGVEFRNPKNISIGKNTVINKKVLLDGRGGKLIIGDNVDIAQETNIWTLEHDPNSNTHQSRGKDVIIEDYVWITSRVTILPGVRIGKGAVIASGSIVTKNVAPLDIVAGIPATIIGKRKNNLQYTLCYKPLFQ